ncbi:hypothetical protein Ancab_028888, partial [Ancistrocladus abbreviatus]
FTNKGWMEKNPTRTPPHKDMKFVSTTSSFTKHYIPNQDERKEVNLELTMFYGGMSELSDQESIGTRWEIDAKNWQLLCRIYTLLLQNLTMRLFGQVSSSSCCKRN